MHSSRLKEALKSTELLSTEIRKRRTLFALNEFIDERINGTQNAIQPLTEDIKLSSVIQIYNKETNESKEELKTNMDDDGVIITEEMCYIPFPFVQSETRQYKDGRRVVTTFYPNNKKIPSKTIEFSVNPKSEINTTYTLSGDPKIQFKKYVNTDNEIIEEKIDFLHNTREIKKFNSYNVVKEIENYIEDRLSFKMQCDEIGNIISEKTYFAYSPKLILKKEILHNTNDSYTTKEYAYDGRIISCETTNVKK